MQTLFHESLLKVLKTTGGRAKGFGNFSNNPILTKLTNVQ
jgi:hypothetical protein